MFPLRDDNPSRSVPVVTILIIAINALVFFWQLSNGLGRSVVEFGVIPAELIHGADTVYAGRQIGAGEPATNHDPAWMTLFSSMFMHGGWMHIIGNMWFLWIFGNNVEDAMGKVKYVLFYLTAGLAAAGAQIATGTDSTIPMVGASGAIGGVLGAYAVLYPHARIHTVFTLGFFLTTYEVPAFAMLGLWFAMNLISGLGVLGMNEGGVAFAAHVGGFVAGLILGRILGKPHHHDQWERRHEPPRDRW